MTNVGDITLSLGDPVTPNLTPAPPTAPDCPVAGITMYKAGGRKAEGGHLFCWGPNCSSPPHNAKLIWDT